SEDHFRTNAHRLVFRCIRDLTGASKVADVPTVADLLNDRGQVGQPGLGKDVDYNLLSDLQTFGGTPAAISQYADAVRKNAAHRRARYDVQALRAILDSDDSPKALEEIKSKLSSVEIGHAGQFADPIPASQLAPNGSQVDWIWPGYIAPGAVTLLTALWKSGKSTLLGHLLKAMGRDE